MNHWLQTFHWSVFFASYSLDSIKGHENISRVLPLTSALWRTVNCWLLLHPGCAYFIGAWLLHTGWEVTLGGVGELWMAWASWTFLFLGADYQVAGKTHAHVGTPNHSTEIMYRCSSWWPVVLIRMQEMNLGPFIFFLFFCFLLLSSYL